MSTPAATLLGLSAIALAVWLGLRSRRAVHVHYHEAALPWGRP